MDSTWRGTKSRSRRSMRAELWKIVVHKTSGVRKILWVDFSHSQGFSLNPQSVVLSRLVYSLTVSCINSNKIQKCVQILHNRRLALVENNFLSEARKYSAIYLLLNCFVRRQHPAICPLAFPGSLSSILLSWAIEPWLVKLSHLVIV